MGFNSGLKGLICEHAPTEDSDNTVKEQFFEDLQRIQDRIPKMMQQYP